MGAMVFPRVRVPRVKFASVLLCSCLLSNVSLITCIFLAPNKGPSINPSHLHVARAMFRAYNKLFKTGLRLALAALVSEL